MTSHHNLGSRQEGCFWGLVRDMNPGPLAAKARIIPLDTCKEKEEEEETCCIITNETSWKD